MAARKKLTLGSLLLNCLFVKDRAKSFNLSASQIQDLKFYRQDKDGKSYIVDDFKLNIGRLPNGEPVILMLSE